MFNVKNSEHNFDNQTLSPPPGGNTELAAHVQAVVTVCLCFLSVF